MNLAYIISAYKYPAQLVRLVKRLMSGRAHFYIHVDRKSPVEVEREVRDGLRPFENVHFLPSHECHYRDFGHVEVSLKGIARLLSDRVDFDYAILLTGQDYPIRSNEQIEDFFHKAGGQSFMETVPLSDPALVHSWPDALERFKHWHIQGKRRAYYLPPSEVHWLPLFSLTSGPIGFALKHGLPRRKMLPGFEAYGGSGYWNLSRACIEYVASFIPANPQFMRFFKYTRIPDEHFFQTMLANSPLRDSVVNNSLRYIDWTGCEGSSPRTLQMGDFDRLIASNALFARKFDTTVDGEILDAIDATIA